MPAMPRANKKAEQIAFSILGVPSNLRGITKISKPKKVEERLELDETRNFSASGY